MCPKWSLCAHFHLLRTVCARNDIRNKHHWICLEYTLWFKIIPKQNRSDSFKQKCWRRSQQQWRVYRGHSIKEPKHAKAKRSHVHRATISLSTMTQQPLNLFNTHCFQAERLLCGSREPSRAKYLLCCSDDPPVLHTAAPSTPGLASRLLQHNIK